jgi:hypothetical protein
VRLAVNGDGSFFVGRFHQAKHLATILVKPVVQVFDTVLRLCVQVGLMRAGNSFRSQSFDVLVNIHVQGHLLFSSMGIGLVAIGHVSNGLIGGAESNRVEMGEQPIGIVRPQPQMQCPDRRRIRDGGQQVHGLTEQDGRGKARVFRVPLVSEDQIFKCDQNHLAVFRWLIDQRFWLHGVEDIIAKEVAIDIMLPHPAHLVVHEAVEEFPIACVLHTVKIAKTGGGVADIGDQPAHIGRNVRRWIVWHLLSMHHERQHEQHEHRCKFG